MAGVRRCVRKCLALPFCLITTTWILLSWAILVAAIILHVFATCDKETSDDAIVLMGNETGDSEQYNMTVLDDGVKTTEAEQYTAVTSTLDSTTETLHTATTAWLELNHSSDTTKETATSAQPELNSTGAATPEPDSDDELTINVCNIRILASVLAFLGYPTLVVLGFFLTLDFRGGKYMCVANYGDRYPDSASDDNISSDDPAGVRTHDLPFQCS